MSWLDEYDDTSWYDADAVSAGDQEFQDFMTGAAGDQEFQDFMTGAAGDQEFQDFMTKAAEADSGVQGFINSAIKTLGGGAKDFLKKYLYNPETKELNLAGIGAGATALYGLMGGNQVQTGGYNKPIPKLTATREQVPYADPNRRPGEAGRSYFTDTQYTAPDAAAATQAAAKTQAQGIASLATPRAKAVNPYEGKYKPAWNPSEQTEKTTTTANPASGVEQLLPPKAQGFKETLPATATQTQPPSQAEIAAQDEEKKQYALKNQNQDSQNIFTDPSNIGGAGYTLNPRYREHIPGEIMDMEYRGPKYIPDSKGTFDDSLQAELKNKQAANSGIASLPSSDFVYSTNPQQAAAEDLVNQREKSNSKNTGYLTDPSNIGGAGYSLNPHYDSTGTKMTMDYQPKYIPDSKGKFDIGSFLSNEYGKESVSTNPMASLNQSQTSSSPTIQVAPTLAAGGLAAGGFVVPADVVAHLGNGSSSAGLALLAAKLNAKAIKGKGDGMSDSIPTHIDGKEKALVANDEAYIDPRMVKRIGGGDTKSGADKLLAMMQRIRKARTGNPKQGKRINPEKFMPGGIAQLAGGGEIQRFNNSTGAVTANSVTTGPLTTSAATPLGTSTSSSLSPWAGDYVTNYLGKGQALAEAPYQAYKGPLTAGASDLQNQAFAGVGAAAAEGYKPTTYQGGTFDATQAQNYMNPYLSASLNPQLDEMRRQAGITRVADAGRMTQSGAFGGSRQAIMESEGNRNLMDKQNQAIGQGYQTAYDKAVQQFNTEQDRRLGAEKSTEASRQYSADYGLKSLGEAASLGAVQRGMETEGINADRQQFEEQRDYPLKMVQYQKDLLQGLPITSAATTANTTGVSQISSQIEGLLGLYKTLAGLGQAK